VPNGRATTPARTLLMIERHSTETTNAPTGIAASYSISEGGAMRNAYRLFKRHNKGINTLMMDGHVVRMSWDNGHPSTSLVADPTGTGDIDPRGFTIDQ
jgi:prepilin-type processing-associated H-X9-DG protein